MVDVFREVRRVLRDDGTLWLNLGDSYTSGGRKERDPGQSKLHPAYEGDKYKDGLRPTTPPGLKPKNLVGIPWRVAFALQADGWYLRSDIIWSKPNPMPESVTDRPTKAHEYIFLLTRSSRYFYDHEAIKELSKPEYFGRYKSDFWQEGTKEADGQGRPNAAHNTGGKKPCCQKANKRSVWTVATVGFSQAHFATFPPKLIEPCILAGTSPQACPKCGAPWKRDVKKTGHQNKRKDAHVPNNTPSKTDSTGWVPTTAGTNKFKPTCSCPDNDGSGRSIVLDPFSGAGTTSLVAMMHDRDSIYIDLNEKYLDMALKRLGFEESGLIDCHTYEVIKGIHMP